MQLWKKAQPVLSGADAYPAATGEPLTKETVYTFSR
jgi:hypothetical protein